MTLLKCIGHLLLCFCITLYKWDYAVVVAFTIVGTQIGSGMWRKWSHFVYLILDFVGIGLALLLVNYLGSL